MKIFRNMIKMKVSVFLLMFLWIPTVCRGDTEVSCVVMETCILPCSFQEGPQVAITWIYLTGINVHTYYDNQDQLGLQDQRFRNRTSLFKDQISRGNASLQLTGVKVQDEGIYGCYTSNAGSSSVNVKVDAPIHEVNIQEEGNNITCSSEGIYPEPELTWSTTPPSNINLHNTTTVQQNEQQLYSISSSLILSDNHTDLIYSCTVTTPTNNRTAALHKTSKSVSAKGVSVAVIVGISVGAALLLLLGCICIMVTNTIPTDSQSGTCVAEMLGLCAGGLCLCIESACTT